MNDASKTEQMPVEVLHEVRQVRKMLETDGDKFDRLEDYEHPERILASYHRAIKKHPPRP